MMSNINKPYCEAADGKRSRHCQGPGHLYCLERTALRGECFCQRWIEVGYFGDVIITSAQWKKLFKQMLRGIEYEYFGIQFGEPGEWTHLASWTFFIYLKGPLERDRVMQRFNSVNFGKLLSDIGCLTNDLRPSYHCCGNMVLGYARRLFDAAFEAGMLGFFASDEAFLKAILQDEVDVYLPWCKDNNIYYPLDFANVVETFGKVFDIPK